jgi:hypothetical protein
LEVATESEDSMRKVLMQNKETKNKAMRIPTAIHLALSVPLALLFPIAK